MQNITIAGRLGRDAELRNTQGGDSVLGFTVAVDYRAGREKATNWWRVSLWGKRGEALAQYLTKGATVAVSGEFGLTEYDGKPQLNIKASEITLLGGQTHGQQDDRGRSARNDRQQAQERSRSFADELSDEVPF